MSMISAAGAREYVQLLRKRLPDKRAQHAIFVAEYLSSFAERAGVDHDRAVTAALLHDLCRTLDNEEMLRRAREYGIPLSEVHHARPNLLHGPVAAEELRHEMGIDDPDVYEAIYWHTTGKPDFCRLGLALYVADFAEPGRDYEEARITRELLRKQGFDAALRYAAAMRWEFHKRKDVCDPAGGQFLRWVEEVFKE